MHGAASLYPESAGLVRAAEIYDEGSAFEAKDYDKFLAITQKQWQDWPSYATAAALSSALACKYAATGDLKYRQQSEEMMETSRQKAGSDPDAQKSFTEYAERIRHRLDTRQIISKTEYDRRFRNTAKQ